MLKGNGGKKFYGNPCKTKEGAEGYCQPPTYCFSQFINIDDYLANRCSLTNEVQGICCSKVNRAPDQNYREFLSLIALNFRFDF
jgi:hypothetical protein